MTTPARPVITTVVVDGKQFTARGFGSLDDLNAAVHEALSNGTALSLDVGDGATLHVKDPSTVLVFDAASQPQLPTGQPGIDHQTH